MPRSNTRQANCLIALLTASAYGMYIFLGSWYYYREDMFNFVGILYLLSPAVIAAIWILDCATTPQYRTKEGIPLTIIGLYFLFVINTISLCAIVLEMAQIIYDDKHRDFLLSGSAISLAVMATFASLLLPMCKFLVLGIQLCRRSLLTSERSGAAKPDE